MGNNKQWLPNKVEAKASKNILLPFDGDVVSSDNSFKFQFLSPGLINNKIPDNMWISSGSGNSLFSVNIPSSAQSRWFIVAECSFAVGITSAVLKLVNIEPRPTTPVKNIVPSKATIILYHGLGTSCWKAVKGNVLVKPMLVVRNLITSPKCGALPFDDYYSFVTIS